MNPAPAGFGEFRMARVHCRAAVPRLEVAAQLHSLILNMLLFPLRLSGYKTTLKMQRVAPQVKAIQEKYKKYSMRDPRKAEMNKEVMAIYSKEGINPVGGCIPQLLQFPIWFGLYRALQGTIEDRKSTRLNSSHG